MLLIAVLFVSALIPAVSAEYTDGVQQNYPEIVYRADSSGDITHYTKGGSETSIGSGYSAVFGDPNGDGTIEVVKRAQSSPYIQMNARNGSYIGGLTGTYDKPKSSSLLGACEINSDGNLLTDILFRDQNSQFAYIDAQSSSEISISGFKNSVGCADFDMDGFEEIIYVDSNSYLGWYNYEASDPQSGTTSGLQHETVSKGRFGTVVHVDSDSRPEFVYPKSDIGIRAVDYQGEASTVSGAVTTFTSESGHAIAPLDWDRDGEPEFAVGDGSQNIHIVDGSTSTDLGVGTYADGDLFSYIPPEITNMASEKVYGIDQNANVSFEASDLEGYTDIIDNKTDLTLKGPGSNYTVEVQRTDSGASTDRGKDFKGTWNTDQGTTGMYQYSIEVRDEKGAGTVKQGSFKLDLERPNWESQVQQKKLIGPEEENILKAKGSDSMNLSEAFLATNETGTFENKTDTYTKTFQSGINSSWANFTWAGSVKGKNIAWKIYYKDQGGNTNSTDVETFKVAESDVEEVNISSKASSSSISIFDSAGDLISSEEKDFSERLETNNFYDLKISSSTSLGGLISRPTAVNITRALNLSSDVIEDYRGQKPPSTDIVTPIYAQDDIQMEKDTTALTIPKNGTSPNSITHCTNWSFQNSECSSWEINSTSDYPYTENSTHIQFNVSEFDAYGAGTTGPLPNITDIRIYDVTGQNNKKTGGTLVDQGLDGDLNISQEQVNRSYRFEFQIQNDGLQNWDIKASDELFHQGLASNWTVGDIWYELPQSNFSGGSVNSGRVIWDTGNGGVLEYQDTNDTMNASYIVNISEKSSEEFDQRFEVNDTSAEAGSFHDYTLYLTKYGFLDVDLKEPPSNTTVRKDSFFVMNATVNCVEGECGTVSVSPRYNESSIVDTLIPETTSVPFYTEGSNTAICNSEGSLNGTCSYSWDVNASGELDSEHLLDVNASSSFTEVSANDSEDKNVRIDNAMRINVTWNSLDFGVLNPGSQDQPAENNSEGYNITVPENSLHVDDLWVRSENMTTDGWKNPSTNESYVIPANNIFYSLNSFADTKDPLTNNYQHVISDLSPGSSLDTYYWIDVPEGIKSSEYTGNIYFKANATN